MPLLSATVSGPIVRQAAKLAVDNPGIVSYDMATILYSKLPLSILMPNPKIHPDDGVLHAEEILEL